MDFERILNLGVEKEIINETQKNSLRLKNYTV